MGKRRHRSPGSSGVDGLVLAHLYPQEEFSQVIAPRGQRMRGEES